MSQWSWSASTAVHNIPEQPAPGTHSMHMHVFYSEINFDSKNSYATLRTVKLLRQAHRPEMSKEGVELLLELNRLNRDLKQKKG